MTAWALVLQDVGYFVSFMFKHGLVGPTRMRLMVWGLCTRVHEALGFKIQVESFRGLSYVFRDDFTRLACSNWCLLTSQPP